MATKTATKKPAAKKGKTETAEVVPITDPSTAEVTSAFRQDLELDAQLTVDEWAEKGWVQQNAEVAPWWFGDWYNYGEARFGDLIFAYIDDSMDPTYINACSNVARAFPPKVRQPFRTSWDCHRIIAYTVTEAPDQKRWLKKAIADKLDPKSLAKAIKDEVAVEAAAEPVEPVDPPSSVTHKMAFKTNTGNTAAIRAVLEERLNEIRTELEKIPGVDVIEYSVADSTR